MHLSIGGTRHFHSTMPIGIARGADLKAKSLKKILKLPKKDDLSCTCESRPTLEDLNSQYLLYAEP